jgi:hypothetical protein
MRFIKHHVEYLDALSVDWNLAALLPTIEVSEQNTLMQNCASVSIHNPPSVKSVTIEKIITIKPYILVIADCLIMTAV